MSKKKNATLMSLGDRERLRVAATVTQESDWPQSEPNQGLARMFVIMLLVHIVVIGGVIIYDFIGDPADSKPLPPNSKAKTTAVAGNVPAAKAVAPLPVVKETLPAPAPSATAGSALTTVPVDSLLPANAPTSTLDTQAVLAAVPAPAALPASSDSLLSAPLSAPTTAPASESSKLVSVSLSSAPVETAMITTSTKAYVDSSPPAPAKITTLTTPVKAAPQAKAKEKTESSPPAKAKEKTESSAPVQRAVALGSQPRPVLTPSAARRSLDSETKRSSVATPTARKKPAADSPPAPKKPAAKSSSNSGSGRYTVAKGDTIYSIARKYKVSEDAVMKMNGIKKASNLQIGKSLSIPGK